MVAITTLNKLFTINGVANVFKSFDILLNMT